MIKAVLLYIIVLIMLLLGFLYPIFSFLNILSLIILILGAILFWQRDEKSITELGFHKNEKWVILLAMGLIQAMILVPSLFVSEIILNLVTLLPKPFSREMAIFTLLGSIRILAIILTEEIVFRGYYLQIFKQKYSDKVGIVVSSILWAMLHFPNMFIESELSPFHLLLGMITLTIWGIGLGIGFIKSQNTLFFCIGFHFAYNFSFTLITTFFDITRNVPEWLLGQSSWTPESGIIGVVFAACILLSVVLIMHLIETGKTSPKL